MIVTLQIKKMVNIQIFFASLLKWSLPQSGLVSYHIMSHKSRYYFHFWKNKAFIFLPQDFVSKLMQLKPSKRMTAQQALTHPWVQRQAAKVTHMEAAQNKLKILNNNRKMKVRDDLLKPVVSPVIYMCIVRDVGFQILVWFQTFSLFLKLFFEIHL